MLRLKAVPRNSTFSNFLAVLAVLISSAHRSLAHINAAMFCCRVRWIGFIIQTVPILGFIIFLAVSSVSHRAAYRYLCFLFRRLPAVRSMETPMLSLFQYAGFDQLDIFCSFYQIAVGFQGGAQHSKADGCNFVVWVRGGWPALW